MTVEESRAGTATLDEVAARLETVEKRMRLDELGKLMAKVQDLELKMQDLEAQANLKEQQIKKTRKVKDAVKSKSELKQRDMEENVDDLDTVKQEPSAEDHISKDMCDMPVQKPGARKARVSFDEGNEGPVKEEGNDEKENSGKKTRCGGTPSAFCALMWGGPTMACSDDTFFSFFERFFGGVTTAHGINRVFDDGIGPLRRIFWLGMFIIRIYGAAYFVGSVIDDYIAKGVTTSATQALHEGLLPMVSVCNLSPFQCSCEAFYDPHLMQDAHFDKVLPYLCRDVLVFKEESPDKLDPKTGERIQFSTLEASTHTHTHTHTHSGSQTHTHTHTQTHTQLLGCCR